jgi:hypothetical protein
MFGQPPLGRHMTLSNLVAAIDSERQHGKVTPLDEI